MGKTTHMDPFFRYKSIFEDIPGSFTPRGIHEEDEMGLSVKDVVNFLDKKKCKESFKLPKAEIPLKIEGFTFIDYLFFENLKTFKKVFYRCEKAYIYDWIEKKKLFRGIYYQKEIKENFHPKIEIRWISETLGYGVFAKEIILPKAFVGEYVGVVKKRSIFPNNNLYAMRYPTLFLNKRDYYIDAEKMGNFTRFFNHSPDPNLEIESIYFSPFTRMIFTAKRKIESGEQLLFDYGDEYWKKKSFERI